MSYRGRKQFRFGHSVYTESKWEQCAAWSFVFELKFAFIARNLIYEPTLKLEVEIVFNYTTPNLASQYKGSLRNSIQGYFKNTRRKTILGYNILNCNQSSTNSEDVLSEFQSESTWTTWCCQSARAVHNILSTAFTRFSAFTWKSLKIVIAYTIELSINPVPSR